LNGDTLQLAPQRVQIVHPVLSGSEYAAKLRAPDPGLASTNPWATEKVRWTACKINARLRW
jgi:hypothetical protein